MLLKIIMILLINVSAAYKKVVISLLNSNQRKNLILKNGHFFG